MRNGMCGLLMAAVVGAAAVAARGADVNVVAGPMVGHVGETAARVWMQFPIAGEVSLMVYDVQANQPVSGVKVGLEGPSPFICDVPVGNLQPDRAYRIEAKFEEKALALPGPGMLIRTTPGGDGATVFSVGFGSDLYVAGAEGKAGGAPIFSKIAELKPRAFLFLGNTGFLPAKMEAFPTTRRAAFRLISDMHARVRREPDLQPLFRTTACYGIYNDRDFGVMGAGHDFVFAQESLVAFERFWPNADWGVPEAPGCYSMFTVGDVDFFLLDTRSYRVEAGGAAAPVAGTQPAAGPTLLGEKQMAWLKKGLKESRAEFKVIAAPCVLFGEDKEGWAAFGGEQKEFVRWLGETHVDGIVGLAGHRPAGELLRMDAKGLGVTYPIFTAGVSTLTEVPAAVAGRREAGADAQRVGGVVVQNNFGTLDFGGQGGHRFVTMRVRDEGGKVRLEQTLFGAQLK